MRFVALRGEAPPADAVVVLRGGVNGLAPDVVIRSASRNLKAFGFLGLSVYLALDEPVDVLCRRLDELRRYSGIRRSDMRRLMVAGFPLLATGDRPHFDIVLADLAAETIARLESAFDSAEPNPGRP